MNAEPMTETAHDLGAANRPEPTHVFAALGDWSWGMDDDGNYWVGDAMGWIEADADEVPAGAVAELERLAEVAS